MAAKEAEIKAANKQKKIEGKMDGFEVRIDALESTISSLKSKLEFTNESEAEDEYDSPFLQFKKK